MYRNDDPSTSLLRSEQLPSVPERSATDVPVTPTTPVAPKSSEMTGASKELSPEKASETFVDARPIDEGIIASVYSFVKKAATVGKV